MAQKINQKQLTQLIQSGVTGTTTGLASLTDASFTVTFPTAFTSAPNVVATVDGIAVNSWTTACIATVHNITTTGCSLRARNTGTAATGQFQVRWMAIGA